MKAFTLRLLPKFFCLTWLLIFGALSAYSQFATINIGTSIQSTPPAYNDWIVTAISPEMQNSLCYANSTQPAAPPTNLPNHLPVPIGSAAIVMSNQTPGSQFNWVSCFPFNTIYTPYHAQSSTTNCTMTMRKTFSICSDVPKNINFQFNIFCDDGINSLIIDAGQPQQFTFPLPASTPAINPVFLQTNLMLSTGTHTIDLTCYDWEDQNGPRYPAANPTRQWNPFVIGVNCTAASTDGSTVLFYQPINPVAAISGPTSVCTGSTTTFSDATSGGTWTSTDPSVATIDPATGVLHAISAGSIYIHYSIGTSACETSSITLTVNNCHCEDPCSWGLTGNTTVNPFNFIGSLNHADFKVRTDNTERMIVTANGNVGINTSSPAQLLDVNGQARIESLPASSANENIVFANSAGDLESLATTGNTHQYLSGDGTWQNLNITGSGTTADQGLTVDENGNIVLGDHCGSGGSPFQENREINMNDQNLYFNSSETGKVYIGLNRRFKDECRELHTRLEISSVGLKAANDYSSPNPSLSGLRFTDLTAEEKPIENKTNGVLSLDGDGDVIWVQACCNREETDKKIADISERLTKLENALQTALTENAVLKNQLQKADVVLSESNMILLNQNVPNPFAESTVISYSIPKSFNKAQIIFRTVTGEIIRAVDIKAAGKGLITVYANDISKGLYTYSLVVDGEQIDTRKMIKQ